MAIALACALPLPTAAVENPNLIRDQAYGADPEERLDLCFPQDRTVVTTLIVGIHGGGLFAGNKAIFGSRVCGWFTPHGMAVASLATLLPGVSSGVDCTIDEWGPVDYTDHPSPLMRKQLVLLFPNAPPSELAANARALSPLLLVHSGMGPVLIEQGISDPTVPLNQSTSLLATLRAHHVISRLNTFVGGHGPSSAAWNVMAETDLVPFIENRLPPQAAKPRSPDRPTGIPIP